MRTKSVVTLLPALLFCGIATAQTNAEFPSRIRTSDGKVYLDTVKLNVYPDGILVSFRPAPGGVGLARLKFKDLPEQLQKQYGYDPKAAADFEKQEAQAAAEWREKAAAGDPVARYRRLAELHQVLGGYQPSSYAVSLDPDGKVSAQAFTGTQPSMMVPNAGPPGYLNAPYGNAPAPESAPPPGPTYPGLTK
ncbi:MAG TPA: hypothetical protein VMU04_05770 [Candidatus Acidoferrum sp.]|nr:hypothetical protein [Candidatus Acidoferrum sp.]